MVKLTTEAEMAEILHTTVERVQRWRWDHKWPHVKTGRSVLYTDAQVEAVVEEMSRRGGKRAKGSPLTSRSRKSA